MSDEEVFIAEVNAVSQVTRSKALRILDDSKTAVVGVILMDITGGARTYIDYGAVRTLGLHDAYDFIHNKKCLLIGVDNASYNRAYETGCGEKIGFDNSDPSGCRVRFCPFCGKEIEIVQDNPCNDRRGG